MDIGWPLDASFEFKVHKSWIQVLPCSTVPLLSEPKTATKTTLMDDCLLSSAREGGEKYYSTCTPAQTSQILHKNTTVNGTGETLVPNKNFPTIKHGFFQH